MRKLIVSAIAATTMLALLAGSAAADQGLSASPSETTLVINRMRLEGGLATVICEVTLDVTLHESIPKVPGTLAGLTEITVSTNSCDTGNAGLLVGRNRATGPQGPYHINYLGFGVTLPDIQSVTLEVLDVVFWITEPILSITCLTNGPQDIVGVTTGGNPARGIDVAAQEIPLTGGILCGLSSGEMEGVGTLSTPVEINLL